MNEAREKDAVTGTETTGHEWDGIKELNTPLPRWWVWTFYVTILWAVGYWIAMPAWPLVSDYTRGFLGYSQRTSVADDIAAADAAKSRFRDAIAAASPEDVLDNPELRAFAAAGGRSAFAVNCSQCHGSGAAGSRGYPNLIDDDWLWGGSVGAIHETIRVGIRSDHPESRINDMPAFLTDGILTREQVQDVTQHVLALSGRANDPAAAKRGGVIFTEQCSGCHAEDGKGMADLGAPNLTDAIWLYGGEEEDVARSIAQSRRGAMPAWEGRLDPVILKELAVYVHTLGGGQ